MSRIQQRHAGGFVNTATLHSNEAIFHDVDTTTSVASTDRVEFFNQRGELVCEMENAGIMGIRDPETAL